MEEIMFLSHLSWPDRHLPLVLLAIATGCQAPPPAVKQAAVPVQNGKQHAARNVAYSERPLPRSEHGNLPSNPTSWNATAGVPYRQPNATQSVLSSDRGTRREPASGPASMTAFEHHGQHPIALDDPFVTQQQLELAPLQGEVLARNQTLAAMRAAWLTAQERYPQARALDDPVLNSGIAGIPGNSAGYVVGGAQKLPWFGKRNLRGQAALAESRAARWDVDDARLQIIESTGIAYYDYYLVRQDLKLNEQNAAKLREFHDIAARKYEANVAPQQDMLQAEVELAELARRQIELERLERIAVARINTLMHRPPDAFLPPAPVRLDAPVVLLSATELRAIALSRRPDLASLSAKLRAEQARLQLAQKEFLPDVEVFGRYDNFWSQASLRGQVGVNMNVPLYRDKRYAAVREAQYRLSQRRAEYQQRIDDINREVQTAYEQFDEAQQTVGLYTRQILPAAQKNVDSAFAAYETGRGDFLRLVAAQRQLIGLQERYQESIANYHRRRVELERVVGQPLAGTAPIEEIPPGR
jgi:cobalt-zinc-cadmium efflux system outer membrane protein